MVGLFEKDKNRHFSMKTAYFFQFSKFFLERNSRMSNNQRENRKRKLITIHVSLSLVRLRPTHLGLSPLGHCHDLSELSAMILNNRENVNKHCYNSIKYIRSNFCPKWNKVIDYEIF